MGGGRSQSSTSSSTVTTTIADSYNTTLSQVVNMSNLGNVSIGGAPIASGEGDWSKTIMVVGLVGVAALALLRR